MYGWPSVSCQINVHAWKRIDLVAVFDAILTRNECLYMYEHLMSNNFRKTTVLKKKI